MKHSNDLNRKHSMAALTVIHRIYRWVVSPVLHALAGPSCGCRFEPSCSEYARQSFESQGLWRGGLLTLGRILRCHPFHRGGWDPAPQLKVNGR